MDENKHNMQEASQPIDVTALRTKTSTALDNRSTQNKQFDKKRKAAGKLDILFHLITDAKNFFRVVDILENDRYKVEEYMHYDRNSRSC